MSFPWKSFRDWLLEEEKIGQAVRIKSPIKAGDPNSIVDAVPDALKTENLAVYNSAGNSGKQMESELRALGGYLHSLPGKPIGIIENPVNNTPDIPVVINPWATRERCMRMWGCRDKEDVCRKYSELKTNLIKPVILDKKDAPVKEVILTGDDVDLYRVPRCWVEYETIPWSPCGGGQWVIYDEETGLHDLSETRSGFYEWDNNDPEQRFPESKRKLDMMITLALLNTTRSDFGRYYLEKYRKKNRPLKAAYVMCNDPGIFGAAVARSSIVWPEDGICDYEAAGGFNGQPVELVPSETIPGLMVPAHAEWVFEGEIMPNEDYVVPDRSEGLYLGYMEGTNTCVNFRTKCITHRKDPMWCVTWSHNGIGHDGMHIASLHVAIEAEAINYLRSCGYDVKDVVNYDLNTVVVQTKVDGMQKFPRYGITVLQTLYGCPAGYIGNMNKFFIAVGPDIDPYDLRDVLFALNTRCQPISDAIFIPKGGGMDPSCTRGPRGRPMFGEQALLDALIKVPERLPDHPQRTDPLSQELKAIEEMRQKIGEEIAVQNPIFRK